MALYIHGPLRCKNLLGRIPNPHSRPTLAAPQHAPGPRSDVRSQRTPPGEIMHRSAAPHPTAAPATERPAPPARPRSDRPAASPDTRSTHPHGPDQTPSRPRWKLCSTRSPTRSGPQTAQKPARPSGRTGFFFCTMEPETARRKQSGRTAQPDRRPHCPLHPYSAGEISHRSGKERTTSTTTAPHPTRAGPHWNPTADPAGSSSNHAHDQTAPHQQADRPALPSSLLWESPRRTPPGTCSNHTQTARKSRSLNRPAHAARHQKQGAA